ncbi:MAG: MATE family efflux transporter [Bacteroidota bacterium]
MPNTENNKRVAKNTLLLYFRMLLTMFVTLYTVRVVLNVLGINDYGLYNVVGGIVIMFSFLSSTMSAASQRFFSFELGKNDLQQFKRTFGLMIIIYGFIALIVLLLAETIGLWFLNNEMLIPPNRLAAANWVFQFSILSFLVTIMTIPYNAAIVAHENMKVYAYVSIVEVVLKLIFVFVLVKVLFDKLILYSILVFVTSCITSFLYSFICRRKYSECEFQFYWNRPLFNTLISYSGWNLFGATATVLNNQGINILLNVFFGPVINGARAIAYQIGSTINQFVFNFQTAINPQITKYYASGDKKKMKELVFQSCKLSFFLLFLISMPVLLETHFILGLWLKKVPEYVVNFTCLIIIGALIDSLSYPLMTAAQATGKIKQYQAIVGGTMLLNLPISYCFLKYGFVAEITMYVAIAISIICLFLRLYMLKSMIELSIINFIKTVLIKILIIIFLSMAVPLLIVFLNNESMLRFILVIGLGLVTSLTCIFIFGLSRDEKKSFISLIYKNRYIKKCFDFLNLTEIKNIIK